MKAFSDIEEIFEYEKSKAETVEKFLKKGVLFSSLNVEIAEDAEIGKGTLVCSGTIIESGCKIGENCVIGPNTVLANSIIGDGVIIESSKVVDSKLEEESTVGPFAHLRNGCVVGKRCRIGNFVELKNSTLGDGSKVSHLSYIGDAVLGKNVNMGCGSITVNYDGVGKYRTEIGDGAFVGCNVNLIAPVKVGAGALVAAGSTITEEVPDEALAIARERQILKEKRAPKIFEENRRKKNR